ncbi:MAG: hypothetical protein MSC30_18395 [Gaiellaceae bacterium MAG52_C11]|nr:hypothetical protein [Candidatus Gaiellasilicea maunaloa]
MTHAVWDATAELADVLRPSAVVSRFGGNLRGLPQRSGSDLPRLLQELFAGYGHLNAQPLLLSLNLGHVPGTESLVNDPAGEEFRDDSVIVTRASMGIVEWLRSRMPRYPIRFKLPYTDPNSSRVADHGFPDSHWPWLLDLRKAGLQKVPTVAPQVAGDVGVEEQAVRAALAALSDALMASPVWARYVTGEAALTGSDEGVLDELVLAYRSKTRADVIDVVEPGRVMRRMQHRHAAVREAEDRARLHGGAVAEYYAAFRAIDKTLGDIVTLLTQLMLYGPPQEVTMRRASWRRHEEEQRLDVSFKTDGFPQRLNEVIRLNVEISPLGGLVIVEGYSVSLHRRGEHFIEDVQVTGVVLSESA